MLQILTILSGLALFGLYVGSVGSNVSFERSNIEINSPGDLRGKTVVTKIGTATEESVRSLGARILSVASIDESLALIESGRADAAVFDLPEVQYFINYQAAGKLIDVPELIDTQYYAIAFPDNSPLVEDVNQALLKLMENGVYAKIYEKYLGTN